MRWFLFSLALLLAAPPARAAAPASVLDDPRLGAKVTLEVRDAPLPALLARLAQAGGVPLRADDWASSETFTLAVRDCPLREVMAALAAQTSLKWSAVPGGGFFLGLTLPPLPPALDTRRLLTVLPPACPAWARIAFLHVRDPDPPIDWPVVYAGLARSLRDTLEDGGEVSFTLLPTSVQLALIQSRRRQAAYGLGSGTHAWWNVRAEDLVFHFGPDGPGQPMRWRLEGADGSTRILPAYQPERDVVEAMRGRQRDAELQASQERLAKRMAAIRGAAAAATAPQIAQPPTVIRTPAFHDAVLDLSRKERLNVLLTNRGLVGALDAAGASPRERLTSLLQESARRGSSWRLVGSLYVLTPVPAPPPPAGSERALRALAAGIHPTYGPLLALDTPGRLYAGRAAWARVWETLPADKRAPGSRLRVSDLSPAQQTGLLSALEMGLVQSVRSLIEDDPAAILARSTLALDFERLPSRDKLQPLGYPRTLLLRSGGIPRVLAEEVAGPMLGRLPASDASFGTPVDLRMKSEPLSEALARLSEALQLPVLAAEPERDVRLTGTLTQRPLRMVLHWIERRTGLQWTQRGDALLLVPPVPVAGPERVLAALERTKPPLSAGEQADRLMWMDLRAFTQHDWDMMARDEIAFGQLSLQAQQAFRDALTGTAEEARSTRGAPFSLTPAEVEGAKLNLRREGGPFLELQVSPGHTQTLTLRKEDWR